MQIEDYFDFLAPDDIRLRGTRVGIESVLYEYIHRRQTPEAIALRFPTLTLEQVYAALLYYLRNREQLDAYLADWLDWSYGRREEQKRDPASLAQHLRAIKEERARFSSTDSCLFDASEQV